MQGSRVLPGDVLLNITGASIGRVCIVPDDICPANVNQHVCIIRCNPDLVPEFLMYFLASPSFQDFIWKSQAGGTRQALTKAMIESFEIPCHPVSAQRRITAHLKEQLTAVDTARTGVEAQQTELGNLANAYIRSSLANGATRRVCLGELLDEVKTGIGAAWRDYPVLGATRAGLAPAKEPVGKSPERYKPVRHGTVFYNPMRILIGSIAMVDMDDAPGITSPDYVAVTCRPGRLDYRWFYYWLRSPLGERYIASLARGAVRERMLFNRLVEGELEIPDWETQRKTSQALAELRPLRVTLDKRLAEIEKLPSRLLAQVFNEQC